MAKEIDGGDFKLQNFHGRPVFVRSIGVVDGYGVTKDIYVCADCGERAALVVVELDGKRWFYCGDCEVGG